MVLLLRSDSEKSLAVKGAYMEVVADTVGSIGVLIAGIVKVTTGWPYADVVVAVLVALWVLPARVLPGPRSAADPVRIVTQPHRRRGTARPRWQHVDGVTGVHDLHVWTLVPGKDMATAHLTSTADTARVLDRGPRGAGRPRPRARHRSGRAARRRRRLRPAGQLLTRPSAEPEFGAGRRVTVVEQIQAALVFVGLADRVGGPRQCGHAAQESRFGSCANGTGPKPFHPLRRS